MELINKTPLAAQVFVATPKGKNDRTALVTAKATFRVLGDGSCQPDTEQPYPIFIQDEETALGLLPRDDLPKTEGFDVIVLGNAHAPGDRLVTDMTISLGIGDVQRSLSVFGNRIWAGSAISPAKPFNVMPVTYANAFGGSVDAEIDKDSFVTIADTRNAAGKGIDAKPQAKAFAKQINAPAGYPKLPEERPLPNIEDPEHLIRSESDSPDPVYWATVPLCSAIQAFRVAGVTKEEIEQRKLENNGPYLGAGLCRRAHPTLDLSRDPEPDAEVCLNGMTPEGELRFRLPAWQVEAEILTGDAQGKGELRPDTLVILPEERRFYLVYRTRFSFSYRPQEQRSIRLSVLS